MTVPMCGLLPGDFCRGQLDLWGLGHRGVHPGGPGPGLGRAVLEGSLAGVSRPPVLCP